MHYEINVAQHGSHLFATHERSLLDQPKAEKLFAMFVEKFPADQGYTVTLYQMNVGGTELASNPLTE